ncbi:MAG: hypothetical protein GC155_04690 [Alphaproteobacteria bacterium]|nr:hypothetical protein [Alphaproteobacteria bacterium]
MADQHTALLIAAINEFRTKANAAFELAKTAHGAATKDAAQTVAEAREFVTKAGLFSAALEMYESTQHYHAWCKHDDWAALNVIGVTDIVAHEDEMPETSAFTWAKQVWAFTLSDVSYFNSSKYGTLLVEHQGRPVMKVRMSADCHADYDSGWRLVDIEALVVGPWVAVLTEMATKMELGERYRQLEQQAQQVRAQAARIVL